MSKRLCLGVVAMACVALVAVPAFAAKDVFFSTVGTVGGGVAVGNPSVLAAPGADVRLYIWSTNDQDYNTSIGMNVVRAGAGADMTAAELYNPGLKSTLTGTDFGTRWSNVGVGSVAAGLVQKMNGVKVSVPAKPEDGVTVNNDGVVDANNMLGLKDVLYDMTAGAFLLGSVDLTVTTGELTTLSINQDGTAKFVQNGVNIEPSFGTASISLIPEPSSLVLITLGLVALVGYRRRG